MKNLPDLEPGQWEFANQFTAIWIFAPGTDIDRGLVRLPITTIPGDAHAWYWDGNKVYPTLSPSILIRYSQDEVVWHGWLRAGILVE